MDRLVFSSAWLRKRRTSRGKHIHSCSYESVSSRDLGEFLPAYTASENVFWPDRPQRLAFLSLVLLFLVLDTLSLLLVFDLLPFFFFAFYPPSGLIVFLFLLFQVTQVSSSSYIFILRI